MTVAHVLITRFNLPSPGAESVIRAREGWLVERIGLFERYTVPSVKAQSVPVRWLVYIDPESPDWLIDRLSPLATGGLLTLLPRMDVPKEQLLSDVDRAVGAGPSRVITTNLDNDDGLAIDFSARLRSVAAASTGSMALYVDNGLILTGDRVYLHRDSLNAFGSVVTDAPAQVTAWEDWHNRLGRHMPVQHLQDAPAWLQVVHARNVSNRVRGRLVAASPYRPTFGHILDEAVDPPRRQLAMDGFVSRPLRQGRDAVRTALRQSAVKTLGPDRFSAVKAAWADIRPRG